MSDYLGMLLLGVPIPLGGGASAPAILYHLRDLFTTDRAAGAVDGTNAEPGPGVRETVDTENKITISTAELKFAGGKGTPAFGDPSIYWTPTITRECGQAIIFRQVTLASGIARYGLFSAVPLSTGVVHNITIQTTALQANNVAETINSLQGVAVDTLYDLAIVLRDTGALYFIRGGLFTDWTLIYVGSTGTTTPLYAGIVNHSAVQEIDDMDSYVLEMASDYAWALYYDATPAAGDTAANAANGMTELTWTPAAAEVLDISIRRLSDDYRIIARCDQAGSTIRLVTVDAGVETLHATAAQTFTVGTPYRIVVNAFGTTVRTLVNGTAKNTQTISVHTANRGVKIAGFATASNFAVWGAGVYGTGTVPVAPSNTFTMLSPSAYQVFQRDGSDQADILIKAILPVSSAIEVEARWQGGSWTSLGTFTGGWCEASLANQAAGQGTLELRCNGQTLSAAYVGIGDVFVIAGQSNASGRGTNNQTYSHATLKAALFGNDYTWKELSDPSDTRTSQVDTVSSDISAAGSVWPLVATTVMASTGFPVAFIPAAMTGTSVTAWQPSANHYDRATLYGSMAYRAKLLGAGFVLWWQGETDALAAMAQATYNSNLDTLANAINTDLGIKIMACKLQACSGITDADELKINDAIAEAWGDNANVLTGPDLTGIATDDTLHLQSNAKLTSAAALWATQILAAV